MKAGRLTQLEKKVIKKLYSEGLMTVAQIAADLERREETIRMELGLDSRGVVTNEPNSTTLDVHLDGGRIWKLSLPNEATEDDVTALIDAVSNFYHEEVVPEALTEDEDETQTEQILSTYGLQIEPEWDEVERAYYSGSYLQRLAEEEALAVEEEELVS